MSRPKLWSVDEVRASKKHMRLTFIVYYCTTRKYTNIYRKKCRSGVPKSKETRCKHDSVIERQGI